MPNEVKTYRSVDKTLALLMTLTAALMWLPLAIVAAVKAIHPTEYTLLAVWVFFFAVVPLLFLTVVCAVLVSWRDKELAKPPFWMTTAVVSGLLIWLWLVIG